MKGPFLFRGKDDEAGYEATKVVTLAGQNRAAQDVARTSKEEIRKH